MKRTLDLLLGGLLLLCPLLTIAQNQSNLIIGRAVDDSQKAISYANAVLYSAQDSSLVKVEYTDGDGVFQFRDIEPGTFWVQLSFVGYVTTNTEHVALKPGKTLDLRTLSMKRAVAGLEEVVVTAERPLLELKDDKMVFNIENSVNATGYNALELLRKSPGVTVDNNDNIAMLGKSGVRIFIDGKPSPLRGDDLANYLRTLQSSDIDAIELITNPSAKYEAEGTAGIINIKLKKDKTLGGNANVNLTYSQGEVARYNGNVNGNYRNKKFNLFGNFGYYEGNNVNFNNFERYQSGFHLIQNNTSKFNWNGFNFKTGLDLFLNKQSTIGIMANGNLNFASDDDLSRTQIGLIESSEIDSLLRGETDRSSERENYNFNLNYRWEGEQGKVLNVDLDYGRFRGDGEEFQTNLYTDPTGNVKLSERINRTESPSEIDIYTFKLDHERSILNGKLGVGTKLSLVQTDNNFRFFNKVDGEEIIDVDRSNQFEYEENVNAGYLTYSRQLGDGWNLQFGVRAEHTHSIGDLTALKETNNRRVERDYLDLFPSGSLNMKLSDKHNVQLSYSRRINRPSYRDLNPFQYKLDELTFFQGNPFLQPEYSNIFQIRHSFNYRINTTVSYTHTSDLIVRQTDAQPGAKEAFLTMLNLADQHNYSLNISAPITITKWWSSFTSVTGYIQQNQGDFGEGRLIDLQAEAFNVYAQQTFKLPKDYSFELSGWYNSPSIWGGNFEMTSIWSMDAGIKKKLFDGRANLKVSISDIFKTNRWEAVSTFGMLNMNAEGGWDSRRVGVNFSYLLGNTQVKKTRNRKTGLEEEKQRISSGN